MSDTSSTTSVTKTRLNGIDMSHWQGTNVITAAGGTLDFVIIKATQGTSVVDSEWKANVEAALAHDKLIGLYHFAEGNDPIAEADHFLKTVKPYIGRALLFLDLEGAAAVDRMSILVEPNRVSAVHTWGDTGAKKFLDHIKTTVHVTPGIYCSSSVAPNLKTVHKAGYHLWEARYASNAVVAGFRPPAQETCLPWTKPLLRQYTATGHFSTYNAAVDFDVAYITKTQWKDLASVNAPKKKPTPKITAAIKAAKAYQKALNKIESKKVKPFAELMARTVATQIEKLQKDEVK